MSEFVKHRQDSAAVLAVVGLIIVTILSVWKLKQFKYRLIHETGVAIFFGMVLGVMVKYLSPEQGEDSEDVCSCVGLNSTPHTLMVNITAQIHCYRHVGEVSSQKNQGSSLVSTLQKETFDPEVLFNLFLPPIIFHGAYTLNQRRFIQNLGSVLTFAFLGTVITCVIIGACVYGFTRLMVLLGQAADGDFLLTDCFLLGAIMSATDPVAVLGLFSELHVDPDLYILLFGESVLNDAVAIALTHAITSYSLMGGGHTFDTSAFFLSAGYFIVVFAGSFLLGFIFTVITALLTKFSRLCENPLLETSLFFLLSWSSFLATEATGLSGIVAVLFCGLSQARYTFHNLSSEAKARTRQLFEFFSFLGEVFIFSYMGYVLLTFPHHVFKALFICGAFLAVFVSRACNIYPLSFLVNLGRTAKIPRSTQHFMVFAGLRGAVAFALAVRDTSTEVRRATLTTTLLLVCSTIWLLGSATGPMLRWLDIRVGVDADENPEDLSSDQVATGRPDTMGLWHRLDYKYLKPVLTHSGPPLTSSLPQCCGMLARLLSSPHVCEDQEQLQETEADGTSIELDKVETQQESTGGNTEPEQQEDLLEGDLGLGTSPAPASEA
ncbi:sodium/hydrogen exchanger 9-like [Myripristis murdjan]|uniref:sodium/hydrogen exchanger 9-like n=1 Tax=Myripristis murdjan TaxID=586833 RepID=UPI001175E58C|nr:sodium/hydrogen exchanger 9-like [Myripristis murdjan]